MRIDGDGVALRGTSAAVPQAGHDHFVLSQLTGGWLWVRLAHLRTPIYLVLLKISPGANQDDVLTALEWWLQSPGRENGDVVEVV